MGKEEEMEKKEEGEEAEAEEKKKEKKKQKKKEGEEEEEDEEEDEEEEEEGEEEEEEAEWPMMRPNALKGNDRIGLIKLFLAFLTKALPTHGPTYRRADGRTHALIEMRGRI